MQAPPGWGRGAPGEFNPKPYYLVRGPSIHQGIRCVLLADKPFHGLSHWIKEIGRHQPCLGEPHCEHCRARRGKRRKGYIAAQYCSSKLLFVLELTDKALHEIDAVLNQRGSLRGLVLHAYRKRNSKGEASKNAEVIIEWQGTSDAKLPEAFDELPHVMRMWGWDADDSKPQHDDQGDDHDDDHPETEGL